MQEDVEEVEAAAANGDPEAQNLLGLIYGEGRGGVPADEVRAVEWYQKAAEQGMAAAQFNLGVHYEGGRGTTKDYGQAIKLYRQAAEQGLAVAEHKMGRLRSEAGRPEDLREAMVCYGKAAKQGHATAQNDLGLLHYKEGDFAQSAYWWRRAAEQGNASAQNNLAVLLHGGKGVPENYIEVYKWYNLAAAQGEQNAIRERDAITKKMTREQIAEGQRRAAEFIPQDESAIADTKQNAAANASEPRGFQDVTHLVERLELFEERLDVRIEGMKATSFISTENVPWLRVCGEVHPRSGVQIKHHIRVMVDVYDASGGLMNSGFQWLSEPAQFFGFETFRIEVNVESFGKIRAYPRQS